MYFVEPVTSLKSFIHIKRARGREEKRRGRMYTSYLWNGAKKNHYQIICF